MNVRKGGKTAVLENMLEKINNADSALMPRRMSDDPRSKLVYSARNVREVKCHDIWPASIQSLGPDEYILQCEHYVHGEWYATKTSLVKNYDPETKTYETRNSFYRIVE